MAVSSAGSARSKVTSRPVLVTPKVSPEVTPAPGAGTPVAAAAVVVAAVVAAVAVGAEPVGWWGGCRAGEPKTLRLHHHLRNR